jgi:hypothetical protein
VGTFAVIIEHVEDPFVEPMWDWLVIVKYAGYVMSIISLVIFIGTIVFNP